MARFSDEDFALSKAVDEDYGGRIRLTPRIPRASGPYTRDPAQGATDRDPSRKVREISGILNLSTGQGGVAGLPGAREQVGTIAAQASFDMRLFDAENPPPRAPDMLEDLEPMPGAPARFEVVRTAPAGSRIVCFLNIIRA